MEIMDIDAVLVEHLGPGFVWNDNAVGIDAGEYSVGVEYYAELDALFLTGEFAGFDQAAAERCGKTILEAGLFGAETGGYAAFGYDAEDEAFVLWDRMLLAETDTESFQDRLARFMAAMEEWTEKFAALRGTT